jgi:calcineurin-like phosphoesterase family protein
MATLFTADTHFGHANIIKLSGRPFADQGEMDAVLIENWNRVVKPNDEVWHLGDFAWKCPARFVAKLRGRIHLIKGNHDKLTNQKARQSFDSVHDVRMVKVGGQQIWLSHYAHRTWPKSHYGVWHLYGHSHGTLPDLLNMSLDVGVDARRLYFNESPKDSFRPWTLEELRAVFEARGHRAETREDHEA